MRSRGYQLKVMLHKIILQRFFIYFMFMIPSIMLNLYIGILLVISSTNAFLFPEGYEIKYKYEGSVKVGSYSEDLISRYDILAEIVVKNQNNGSHMSIKFNNVTYKVHVGSKNEDDMNVLQPSEYIKRMLELPILIVKEGNNQTIKFHRYDKVRSMTLKRAIALLLDKKILDQIKSEKIVAEDGNTTKYKYSYSNTQNKNEYSIEKHVETDVCQKMGTDTNLLPKLGCNAPSYKCEVHEEFNLLEDSKGLYVKDIISDAEKWMPFGEYFSSTSQKVTLVSINEIEASEKIDENYLEISEHGSDQPLNVKKLILKVKKILANLDYYFETKQIDLSRSLVDQDNSFFTLINHLKKLDEKDFLKIFDDLSMDEKVREIFSHVLPYVGTNEAIKAICHLILKNLVDDFWAMRMLQNIYRLNIPQTSVFVKKLEDLTKKEAGLSERVRWTATLAFAATLNNFGNTVLNLSKDDLDEYANSYSKSLLDAKDYKEKFLLINALSNMQTGNISPILSNIISGKGQFADLHPHLRTLSMLSSLQYTREVLNKEDDKKIEDVYMPIFINKMEYQEVRMMALNVLMKVNDPKIWTELYTHMATESENMRNFYYNILKNIADSDAGCYKNKAESAKILLEKSSDFAGRQALRHNNLLRDFIDPLKNIGFIINSIMIGSVKNDKFLTFLFDKSFNIKNTMIDQISVYMYMDLTNDWVNSDIDLLTAKNLPIEIVVMRRNVIIFANVFNNFAEVIKSSALESFFAQPQKMRFLQILNHQTDFTNGIGMPIEMYFNYLNMFELNSFKPVKFSMDLFDSRNSLELSYKERENIEYGIKVFNPITNNWHGVRRVQSLDKLSGIGMNFKDSTTRKTELNLIIFTENNQNVGFKTIGQTEAFIIGEEIIHQSCAECHKVHVPQQNSQNLTVWENDDDNTGLLYQFKIFDCDEEVIKKHKTHFKAIIAEKIKKLNIISSWETFIAIIDYIAYFPGSGTCGLGLSIGPSQKHPMTHLKFRMYVDPNTNIGFFIGRVNGNKIINSLDLKLRKGTEEHNHQIDFTRFSDGKPENTCINVRDNISKHSSLKEIKVFRKNCNEHETVFSIKLTGSKTNEDSPKLENSLYEKCISNQKYQHIVCATEATSLRNYKLELDYEKLPDGIWKDVFLNLIHIYDQSLNLDPFDTEPGSAALLFNYPVNEGAVVEIDVIEPTDYIGIIRVNLDYNSWPFLTMPQSVFGYNNIMMSDTQCLITMKQTTSFSNTDHRLHLANEWVNFLSDCKDKNNNCTWIISAKAVDETMAFRISIGNKDDELEKIVFYMMERIYVENGSDTNDIYKKSAGVEYRFLNEGKVALVYIKNQNILIGFDGNTARITEPYRQMYNNKDLCSV